MNTTSRAGSPSFVATAWVLARMAWARTMSPPVIAAVAGLVVLPMVFALLFAMGASATVGVTGDATDFLLQRYGSLVSGLATPLIALLLGTGVWNAEAEDGTLLYLVTTTTPRWWIVASRWLFAALLTGVLSVVAVWGTGMIVPGDQNADGLVTAFSVAVLFGSVVYSALFTLLALLTRRALMVGLLYVILWEGALTATFQALRYLSVRQWMITVAASMTGQNHVPLEGGPSTGFVIVSAIVVVLATIWLGGRSLHRPRIARS